MTGNHPAARCVALYTVRALDAAASLCQTRAHAEITIEHWLLKLLEQGEGDITVIARRYEWDIDTALASLLAHLDTLPAPGPRTSSTLLTAGAYPTGVKR